MQFDTRIPRIGRMTRFIQDSFFLRFIIAAVVVFLSYNAEGFSFFHWIINNIGQLNLYMALAAIILVLAWLALIRASIASLTAIGFALTVIAFAVLAWLLIHHLGLSVSSKGAIIYIIELAIVLAMSVGAPVSYLRHRFSRQAKTDQATKNTDNKTSQSEDSEHIELEETQKISPPVDSDDTLVDATLVNDKSD